tara:strand:+ start:290 stop:478 length:189 start_codon:yes stop_codon:yes gene_type:complete
MIVLYVIIGLLLFLVGWAIYLTFGPGSKELVDGIDEHAKMHELGVAHSHKEGTYRILNNDKK